MIWFHWSDSDVILNNNHTNAVNDGYNIYDLADAKQNDAGVM